MRRASKNSGSSEKIDIHSVAAHAKVSIATVSRTINRLPTVDPQLARRVWKAVEELNYTPNPQARALVSGRSHLLGLIISDITNPFFPELIHEFEKAAVARGYEILIGSTSDDQKTMEVCARRMIERKVDAIAVMTFAFEEQLSERFAGEDIPLVSIDVRPKNDHSSVLSVDYRSGIAEGVQHLAVLGHRKIGFISGPLRLRSAQARKTAFLECLSDTGIKSEPQWLIEGDHTLAGGRDAMQKILVMREWPTAIMCSNDMTAIGVQHALFEANLRVPKDFSLIGFDDIHLAEYTIPPLTTVRMSPCDIARSAVARLISRLESKHETLLVDGSSIPTRLIVRRTTDLPRGALVDLKRKR
jgi:DNA-binding LacI/PurR family transcriptional regulator